MVQKEQKIVSLLPSSTEIVSALGIGDRLVGVTHECDHPPGVSSKPHVTASRISHETMSSREIDHAVRSHLDGHGSIYDLDAELLGILDPDLILTQELCDVCAVNYKMVSEASRIYAAGATVVSLEPTTIGEILGNIITVGELCGVADRAHELAGSLRGRLDRLRAKSAKADTRPSVFMLEWLDPPFAPGHWVPEQVEIAGGSCILGESGEKSVTTTFEKIANSNPDILVLIPCGFYTGDTVTQLGRTVFPDSLKDINAVRKNDIWALDATSYFSRPGPRVIEGAEILAKVVHPELFSEPLISEALRIEPDLLRFHPAGESRPVST